MMRAVVSIVLILSAALSYAQVADQPLKKGNKLYSEGKFDEAEIEYRRSMERGRDEAVRSQFNLGDALYKQERYEEASSEFAKVAATAEDEQIKAQALHNLGNSRLKENKLEKAIEAYKNSLKLNPKDDETRTNLARALKKLQKQKQQQKQNKKNNKEQDQDKKEDQKQNQDQQNQQQDQQQQDQKKNQQQQDQKEQKPQDKKGEQQKPKEGEISRQDAERLLEALAKEEEKVQQKVNKEKVKGKPTKSQKDW